MTRTPRTASGPPGPTPRPTLGIAIDRVTVSGLAAAPRSGAAVGRSVEHALGRLLAAGGLPAALPAGDLPAISLRGLRVPAGASDAEIAEHVAAAIHQALQGGNGR